MARDPHPKLPPTRKPMPPPGTPEHEEWLVDEAVEESFPAPPPEARKSPRLGSSSRLRPEASMNKLCTALLCAAAFGSHAAYGQALYKCVGASGKTSYQEDPCPVAAAKPEGARLEGAKPAPAATGAPMKAGWDAREIDAAADACSKPILADARKFFDAESKFFPEAQIVPPVDRFCTCVTRRIASTWTYAEYSKNPGGLQGRIAGEAFKGGPCKPDGLYAEMLRKTGKTR